MTAHEHLLDLLCGVSGQSAPCQGCRHPSLLRMDRRVIGRVTELLAKTMLSLPLWNSGPNAAYVPQSEMLSSPAKNFLRPWVYRHLRRRLRLIHRRGPWLR